ncbi:MAG: SsrA-binding protein SmpB [Kiritimatiellia bacterium]|jgi:SsrA-binding protein|nr:SsrA-binding protein SmpB [Kiritimatiellia bacterium]MDP6848811.1 SsrA-binding protein SmpB [Kiritimatiellia bacterium]
MSPGKSSNRIASNRRALHDYSVLERIEAGVELKGTEVKSLRAGHVSMTGCFARIDAGEVFLQGFNIPAYEHGNRFNHDSDRPKRLLLHRKEITRLQVQTEQKGLSVIPLNVYLRRGKIKVELGVCKGKRKYDKRETLRRRTADRDAKRAMARETGRRR